MVYERSHGTRGQNLSKSYHGHELMIQAKLQVKCNPESCKFFFAKFSKRSELQQQSVEVQEFFKADHKSLTTVVMTTIHLRFHCVNPANSSFVSPITLDKN